MHASKLAGLRRAADQARARTDSTESRNEMSTPHRLNNLPVSVNRWTFCTQRAKCFRAD